MARYVLVQFDDNGEADAFVKALSIEGGVFFMGADGHFRNSTVEKVNVLGVFAKPSKFCECAKPGDNLVRGAKLGWLVHRGCGKPLKNKWQHPRNLIDDGPVHKGLGPLYLGIVEPEPTDGNVPPGQGPQPPRPAEDPNEDYASLNLKTRADANDGWGQCHNLHCNRWYKASEGYWFEGINRTYAVCSRPCAMVLKNQGK